MTEQEGADWIPPGADISRPSAARIYDYLLGGAHNLAADRAVAQRLEAIQPQVATVARRNRAFLRRVVRFMVEQGVRQFLDLGSGIPTVGNVHEVAQAVDPAARVVYVDYEPVAVAHSLLLLKDNPNAEAIEADATNTEVVLKSEPVRRLIDLDEPVGLLAVTLGHYLPPEPAPRTVFAAYRDALASGSYFALTHLTNDFAVLRDPKIAETMRSTQDHIYPRTRDEVLALFEGFELVEPGLTTSANWRPDRLAAVVDPEEDGLYAGVGVKP
ncbi:SAM-dependent methyltransferase [Amycolatopsis australiensis]|uniref:S-adenosyl methyltransferase n=1 Tax=Amycolatopsis australiensis TaxID=546364 RepID=A0A1K1SAC7_9PSEU|nr:SAM-dependent methyltransferase [Amycolatopsis australiensis]SFW81320.1 S-adenosyl methyltransferase [Amycolatopsis australiensis]